TPAISGVDVAIYDFSQLRYVDTSAALAIEEMILQASGHGMHVLIAGLTGNVRQTLENLGVLAHVPAGQVFTTRLDAIRAVSHYCERRNSPPQGAPVIS